MKHILCPSRFSGGQRFLENIQGGQILWIEKLTVDFLIHSKINEVCSCC
jgi:hypothetical protein